MWNMFQKPQLSDYILPTLKPPSKLLGKTVLKLPPVNSATLLCEGQLQPLLIGNYLPNKTQRSACAKNQTLCTNVGLRKWQRAVPPGTNACLQLGTRAVPQEQNKHESTQDIFALSSSSSSQTKRQYFNIMWDPRICRGRNLIRFSEVQRAKCQQKTDLNSSMLFRHKRRFREGGENEHVTKITSYPEVKIKKEPLAYEAFAQFLTDQTEVTYKDASQSMQDDHCNESPPVPYKKQPGGISVSVQTDKTPSYQQTTDWIVKTLVEKIPQQAVLELAEEAELEALKGERQRHEMILLYRKWQKMKADQWNEYVKAWNELRMADIRDEDFYLGDQQEQSVGVIAFAKNAINCCFLQTFEMMKVDGFISKEGVPHEELDVIKRTMGLNKQITENRSRRDVATEWLDSCMTKAVIRRFSEHMKDDFGRPHGRWLSLVPWSHSLVAYDSDLQKYLDGRGFRRRGGSLGSSEDVRSDVSLYDIFLGLQLKALGKAGYEKSSVDLEELIILPKFEFKKMKSPTSIQHSDPVDHDDHIKPLRSSGEGDLGEDNVSLLYKRNTRWSMLEMNDHHHHQQKEPLGNKRESKVVPSLDERNAKNSGVDAELEVDKDKLNISEEQRNSIPLKDTTAKVRPELE